MKILISPTKTLRENTTHRPETLPVFLEEAGQLHERVAACTESELMERMKIRQEKAQEVRRYLDGMKFDMDGLYALEAFDGLQYKRLSVSTLSDGALEYLKKNVYIFSGLYGFLRPTDSMYPHRLDFNMKFDLYGFWGSRLAKILRDEEIWDLSSSEFTKAVYRYLKPEQYHAVAFREMRGGRWKTLSTSSKILRGLFLRFLAEEDIENTEDMRAFTAEGFVWREDLSDRSLTVFGRDEETV